MVDDEVENLLLDNYGIEALIKVSNVKLRSSAKIPIVQWGWDIKEMFIQ